MIPITYLQGDATQPIDVSGEHIIVHCVNDIGRLGSGFVVALAKQYPKVRNLYIDWALGTLVDPPFALGEVQFIRVAPGIIVANIVGQRGISTNDSGVPPIRYAAIEKGMRRVAEVALRLKNASVHMPRIGCGLAGGSWDMIEPIILKTLSEKVCVFVYDL